MSFVLPSGCPHYAYSQATLSTVIINCVHCKQCKKTNPAYISENLSNPSNSCSIVFTSLTLRLSSLCVLCEKSSSPNSKQILVLFKYRLKTVPLLISFPNVILHLIKISLLRGSWRVCYINIGISFLESTTNFTNWLVLWKPELKNDTGNWYRPIYQSS